MSAATSADDARYRPCVGAMLINRQGLVFVGQRTDTRQEAWQMPHGGIEADEAPDVAVLRELKEEIGTDKARILAETAGWHRYDLPPELQGKVWGGRYCGQSMKWFLLAFTGVDADIRPESVEHPEFRTWRWTDPAGLPEAAIGFKRAVYEAVLAQFLPAIRRFAGSP